MKIIEIQQRLVELGFKPGALDGIWGRKTAEAVRAFQRSKNLDVDGVVGPLTLAALFPQAPVEAPSLNSPTIVWFKEATRLIGTREQPGRGSSPEIIDWAGDLGVLYGDDDIPWCGLFVGHCIGSTLGQEPLPSDLLRARAWAHFGIATQPTPGAIMVFWRESPTGAKGHVGFYAGEDDKAYRILGGNQSNQVSLAWIAKSRLLASRWPATVAPPIPVKNPVATGRSESLSWNEA